MESAAAEKGQISLSEKLYKQVANEEISLEKLNAILRFLTPLQQTIVNYLYIRGYAVSLRNIRDAVIDELEKRIVTGYTILRPKSKGASPPLEDTPIPIDLAVRLERDSFLVGSVEARDPARFLADVRLLHQKDIMASRDRRDAITLLLTKHKVTPKPPSYEALRSAMAFLKNAGMVASISGEGSKADEFYNLAPGFFIAFDKLKQSKKGVSKPLKPA